MIKNSNNPLETLQFGKNLVQVAEEDSYYQKMDTFKEEEYFMDFGDLNDYSEIFGEMDNL